MTVKSVEARDSRDMREEMDHCKEVGLSKIEDTKNLQGLQEKSSSMQSKTLPAF